MFIFNAISSRATLLFCSQRSTEKTKGRNWVSSPQLIAVTLIRCVLSDSAPLPQCVGVCVCLCFLTPFYQPLLTHLPYASSFHFLCFDLALSVHQHGLICTVDLCSVLFCLPLYPFWFPYSNIGFRFMF